MRIFKFYSDRLYMHYMSPSCGLVSAKNSQKVKLSFSDYELNSESSIIDNKMMGYS